jgi:hypothetical protein
MARKHRSSSSPTEAEIGYKRPPLKTRFKEGQSGNPSGKKKPKPLAQEDDCKVVLSQPVTMILQGKRVTVTARRALHHKLVFMAMNNDLRAMAFLLKLEARIDNEKEIEAEKPEVTESDTALIARFLRRHTDGGPDDNGQGGAHE